jgi:hypothetical protein
MKAENLQDASDAGAAEADQAAGEAGE